MGFVDGFYLQLSILHAVFSLLMGALGLYFVFRWGEVVRVSDARTRELLLGPTFAGLVEDGSALAITVSVYLGYSFLMLLVRASSLRHSLQERKMRAHE